MYPYTSPAEVRAWYAERLDAAAQKRLVAANVRLQAEPQVGVWQKLVAWLTPARSKRSVRALKHGTQS